MHLATAVKFSLVLGRVLPRVSCAALRSPKRLYHRAAHISAADEAYFDVVQFADFFRVPILTALPAIAVFTAALSAQIAPVTCPGAKV